MSEQTEQEYLAYVTDYLRKKGRVVIEDRAAFRERVEGIVYRWGLSKRKAPIVADRVLSAAEGRENCTSPSQ